VAESMLEAKSKQPSSSSTMNPNITWSDLLESYHPYLTPQKVSKNPQYIVFIGPCSKVQKVIVDAFRG
jgi:hypothetical protein